MRDEQLATEGPTHAFDQFGRGVAPFLAGQAAKPGFAWTPAASKLIATLDHIVSESSSNLRDFGGRHDA